MKFNARQVQGGEHAGQWAVFMGKSKFWPHTASDTFEEANVHATIKSAEWHAEQARELIAKLKDDGSASPHAMKNVGVIGNELCDDIVVWCSQFDPDHDEMDPKCWTC